jgi:hypothetical protein
MNEIKKLIGHLKLDSCDVCGCPYPHLYQLDCHDLFRGVGVNGLGDLSRSSKLLPAWLPYNGYPTEATVATEEMEIYIYCNIIPGKPIKTSTHLTFKKTKLDFSFSFTF